jgi:hypothetical protein
MGVAGSITADGQGHITGGSVDVNDNQVISSSSAAIAGSYTIDSNFRGVISLTYTVGSVTHPLGFAFTLKADGSFGEMIGSDANKFVLSGTMQKQDATAFFLTKLAGNFAFEVDSRAPAQLSVLGRFTLDPTGACTNVFLDGSVSGVGATGLQTGGTVAATFAVAGPNGSGRGTLSLTDQNNQTPNFVYYVVDAGTVLTLETDPPGGTQTIYTGVANKQSMPFTSTTVNTAASVFALSGFDFSIPNDIVTIGLLQISGSNTASLLWDTNDIGTIFVQPNLAGQAVTFDSGTGRGTITIAGGLTNGLFDTGVFYLTDSGKGFLADATPGTSNRALAGRLQAQTGSGSFAPTTLAGKTMLRQTGISVFDNGAADGLFSESVSSNTLTGTAIVDFLNLAGSSVSNQSANLTAATIAIDATTGRGSLTFPSANNAYTNTNVFYLIGQNHYVLIDETPLPHNAIPTEFHDPQ